MLMGYQLRTVLRKIYSNEFCPITPDKEQSFANFSRWTENLYGIMLQTEYDGESYKIESFEVMNEEKYSWFILKWT